MTKIIVKIGQSNTLGEGMNDGTLPGYLIAPNPSAYVFTQSAQYWGALIPGENTGSLNRPDAWGSIAQEAYRFGVEHPGEPILFIQIALGQRGLTFSPSAQDWSPSSRDEMFDMGSDTIRRAIAQLDALGIEHTGVNLVEIYGGESDAYSLDSASSIASSLSELVAAIRSDWMGNIDGRIVVSYIGDGLPYSDVINSSIQQVDNVDDNLVSFNPVDELQSDGIHITAVGHVNVGNGFADHWLFQ